MPTPSSLRAVRNRIIADRRRQPRPLPGSNVTSCLGGDPRPSLGNLLLDRLLGAEVHWTPKTKRNQTMADLADKLEAQGRRPYVIPIGGSNAVGAVGYVQAMIELADQLGQQNLSIDRIVLATSSGGTHAGMALGAKVANFSGQLTAISIDQTREDFEAGFCREVLDIAAGAAELLGVDVALSADDFQLRFDYLGRGYGVVGDLERNAIREVAQTEGLLVGPVYTSRAMGAMLDLIRRGEFGADESILFWHTGDESALHAYADDLLEGGKGER